MEGEVTEYIDLVRRRAEIMEAIAEEALELRTVQDRTGASRSTVNRAIRSLEEAGLAERSGGAYTLTAAGRLALEHHRSYCRRWEDLAGAAAVLDALPRDAPIDLDVIAGAEATVPPEEAPYRPVQRLQAAIGEADRYRGILPGLSDPREIRLLYEHVVTDGNPAELVVSEELHDSLTESFPRRLPAMADTGNFDLLVGEVPPYGLVLTEADGATTVTLIAFGESGTVEGVLENDGEAAVRWAEDRYAGLRENARVVADPGRETTDGGVRTRPPGADAPPDTALERQGFVRLDQSYFVEREVADPATAWRAGLDLAEVHTGYAAERTDADGTPLADRLIDTLEDGEDCVLLGPPGSGKSTTAKRVACEWYEADRGVVFYRESGRGTAFDAVEELVAAVDGSDGHALVVVEDAVRPDAAAVFAALDRLAGREDVSVLLDARESEWRDPPDGAAFDPADLDLHVEHMPRLDGADYERLVEQFERTAGVSVDAPVERLREDVRSGSPVEGPGDAAPGEVLLLLHRLSGYADPLAGGPTDLEADAAGVYRELRDRGELALDVATVANALNAAGIAFGPEHLRVITGGGGEPEDGEALREALGVLDGRVVFGLTDGGAYRTVHEAWSVAFLAAMLDADGEAAARERFGRCVSAVLGLEDAPPDWPEEAARAVFGLGREWPKLAPLLGDGSGPSVALPDAAGSITGADCRARLGWAFLDAGAYDRAEAVFEGLPDDGDGVLERRHGLAAVAERRGDYDQAESHARACLALAEERDDREAAAAVRTLLGDAAFDRTDHERAREYYEEALATARDVDDRRLEADCLHGLGRLAEQGSEFDRARERYEESLAIRRETGDRRGEAVALKNLGTVALRRGEFDAAVERTERSLEVFRDVGDRGREAKALHNLGAIALRRDEYERAGEYFEESLAIKRETGDRRGEASTLVNLGVAEQNSGAVDRAEEHHREALAVAREVGARHTEATCLSNLGSVAYDRNEYDRARARSREALEVYRDVGDERGASVCLLHLGEAAQRQGAYDRARERYEESLAIRREVGLRQFEAESLARLASLADERGHTDRAREFAERALEVAREVGSPREEAESLRVLGSLAGRRGEYDRARERFAEARSRFEDCGRTEGVARTRLDAARAALSAGEDDRAREQARAARETFASLGLRHWLARSRLVLGRIAARAGDHENAREHRAAALDTFEAVGAPRDALAALEGLVETCRELGDHEAAHEYCERAIERIEDADRPFEERRLAFEERCRHLDGSA